ncbi:MAG: lactate/malate family dehydrogenase [Desulfomonilia bacterium]
MKKILVIGAGKVGSSCAASLSARCLGPIFLYDRIEGLSTGRAMDINHARPCLESDSRVIDCRRLEDAHEPDIIVFTAGSARHAGMTRLDLLKSNISVVDELAPQIVRSWPNAKMLVVTNPVDVITWHLRTAWPRMNSFGLGCCLDTVRFRYFIAEAASVSVSSVQGIVIGTHDDHMIPLFSSASIGGVPVRMILGEDELHGIREKTRSAGGSIVKELKDHSGHLAAGEVIACVVESIAHERAMVFPLTTYLKGEYGYHGICLSLPCVVDHTGVRNILEMNLHEDERTLLDICACSMDEITGSLQRTEP